MSLLSRLRNLWRERELGREFDEELRFHLETRIERNMARGMTRPEADAEARRSLGGVTQAREGMRDARVIVWIGTLRQDLVYGVRLFRRQPIISGLVALTLSLGIGANATIFSLLYSALFRAMSFAEPDRLVEIVESDRITGATERPYTPAVLDVRARSRSLETVSFFAANTYQVSGGTEPERIPGVNVDPAFFDVLAVKPALGRLFVDSDTTGGGPRRGGAAAVAVISDGLWRRSFSADREVIGRSLRIDSEPHVIVGVLPAGFSLYGIGPPEVDLYLPTNPGNPATSWSGGEAANYLPRTTAIARLSSGITIAAASAELAAIAAAIVGEHPTLFRRDAPSASAYVLRAEPVGRIEGYDLLYVLFGAVAFVLLIACLNTVQFLLAQAIHREPEVALRTALGAGRWRLLRQFLSEALILSLVVGTLAALQTMWLMALLRSIIGATPSMRLEISVPVVTFLVAVSLVTVIGSSLLPALRFSRADWGRTLVRHAARQRNRTGHVLIATEVALSFILLVGTGVLLRSTYELQRRDRGVSPENVATMNIRSIGERPQLHSTHRQFLEALAEVPGVRAAAIGSIARQLYSTNSTRYAVVGRSSSPVHPSEPRAWYEVASPHFFNVLGLPLLAGRAFTDRDVTSAEPVAIINREMAEREWPGESPLGRQIQAGQGDRTATMTIVGVVGNITPLFETRDVPQIYASYAQQTERDVTLWIGLTPGAALPASAIKEAIWSVQPDQAVLNLSRLDDALSIATDTHRITAWLIGSFAALAAAMSLAGIYALIVFLTSRRLKEIAIRRAVGAGHADILWLFGSQTFRWAMAGLAVGTGGAYLATRAGQATLPGLLPLDTTTLVLVGAFYVAIVSVAMGLATIRALRVDPVAALRAEQ